MTKSIAVRALALTLTLSLPLVAQEMPKSAEVSADAGALHGTLLTPPASKPVPVVLIIAGSGPTDRNGNSPALPGANDSLRLFATGLAANGIASLRYDKRGIGESKGATPLSEADLRFDTYVDDAVVWCNQLRKDPRFSSVMIAGHSEGSLIGMIAARRCGAAGFISLDGAGRPAAQIIRTQLAGKLPPEMAEKSERMLVSLEQGKTSDDFPPELQMLYRKSVQPYLISWFRYDPTKEIAALTVPVLIVQGTTDIQVGVADSQRLAAANTRAKLVTIDGMNHVLKSVADSQKQAASYSDPTLPLADGLMRAVVAFVKGVKGAV